ncbi:hypothetical protein SLEP1_g28373 [Rubroshorea leprosula]|uniref:Uncharacterized protein n=1 Tax=Rubroshorea leprosula TaxID=152421 RepID=A0AAV5K4D3_9ROSI|nr:hypothetical protein SLEP1_g28373 [Rubroshorea leprosula]
MSIALQRNSSNSIQRSGFIHGMPCISVYGSSEEKGLNARARMPMERDEDSDSCSSSSIGRNSDASGGSSDCEDSLETEVQSSFKGPLDTLDDLEEVLPIRRGMSKFYSGKSKSFTSLADAATASSIEDFAKPENPYTRKRKNLLAHAVLLDKNHKYPPKDNGSEISKRQANYNRSTVTPGAASNDSGQSNSLSLPCALPPLHPQIRKSPNIISSSPPPQQKPPCRSFSLSDLQCVAAVTPNITGLAVRSGDKDNKLN